MRGAKPKDGLVRHHDKPAHEWVEIENVPFEKAPELPARSPAREVVDGEVAEVPRRWPAEAVRKWRAWSRMPHCVMWSEADWEFAFDSLEVAASFIETRRASLATELRNREKVLGTTADFRRDLRIRYVDVKAPAAFMAVGDDLHELYD
ncbi:hypothetical protein PXH80_26115 [Mycolicibacterium smegmatis]|uniref:phage terminase small subunit n=1 Tax=Mycolicibacterium smegmatis TaxID=1772 RepID=UPI0023DCC0F4|nr:hypothetical protein [Mycolicibacterium smegmatis]MDF1909019.1 hypothetical protein [Mycolicibacterium smegmatis]